MSSLICCRHHALTHLLALCTKVSANCRRKEQEARRKYNRERKQNRRLEPDNIVARMNLPD